MDKIRNNFFSLLMTITLFSSVVPASVSRGSKINLNQVDLIPGMLEETLDWLATEAYHSGNGFYLVPFPEFQTWDTTTSLWLFSWLQENNFDVSAFTFHTSDALQWLHTRRHQDGSFPFGPPRDGGSCTEVTSLAALVVPDDTTDQWIIDQQQLDGHWSYLYDFLEDLDYPSITTYCLYAAACRDLEVDWDSAISWLSEINEYSSDPDYYTTRFYMTYLLAPVAAMRGDFPDSLTEFMSNLVLEHAGTDGTFEGRSMDDNPSAIVSTALALQTALYLNDNALDEVVENAVDFLLDRFEEGHWDGGQYTDLAERIEDLFATIMATRALVTYYRFISGEAVNPCSTGGQFILGGDDDDTFADDDDDTGLDDDDDDNNDDDESDKRNCG